MTRLFSVGSQIFKKTTTLAQVNKESHFLRGAIVLRYFHQQHLICGGVFCFKTHLPNPRSSLFLILWIIITKLILFVLIKILLETLFCLFSFGHRIFFLRAISLIFIDVPVVWEADWCDSIHWHLLKWKLPHNNYWWEGACWWSRQFQQNRNELYLISLFRRLFVSS